MVRVIWASRAEQDVISIRAYVAKDAPLAAQRLALKLIRAGNALADNPLIGRRFRGSVRELVTVPPYLIRYRLTADVVEIVRIRHGAQRR